MPIGASEFGSIALTIDGTKLTTWKEYTFNSHFLVPTDGWSFTLGDEITSPDLLKLLTPGAKVTFTLDDVIQGTGYIDKKTIRTGRSGTEITIEGRDTLSTAVDSMVDPKTNFADDTPLIQVCQKLLKPLGFDFYFVDNKENRSKATGKDAISPGLTVIQLDSIKVPKTKPNDGEAIFSYLSRITQRFGLWIWATVDGLAVVVSKPDFAQAPRYTLRHNVGGATNNILSGEVCWDATDQPSFIVARGSVPGKTFQRSTMTCVAYNGYAANSRGGSTEMELEESTETVEVPSPPVQTKNVFASKVARPLWVKDDKSKTQEQLQKFVLRELSLRQRKAFTAKYTVLGHQNNGQAWAVDTVVDIDDERSALQDRMYVLGRTFKKSRHGGTTTDLDLIALNTLVF